MYFLKKYELVFSKGYIVDARTFHGLQIIFLRNSARTITEFQEEYV